MDINKEYFCNGDWQDNAILSNGRYSWEIMSDGYFHSANILVASVLNNDFINNEYKNDKDKMYLLHTNKNSFIFPIVFLYRHYIELSLKNAYLIIQKYNFEDKRNTDEHSLKKIFIKLEEAYSNLYKSKMYHMNKEESFKSLKNDFKKIEPIIFAIDALDNTSTNFRYPTDKQGKLIFNNNEIINIDSIAEKMLEVNAFMESFFCTMDLLEEMRSYILEIMKEQY